jgi:restriction endonuclease S subunit
LKASLKDITTIQTGFFAKPISKGEIVYLQAKHFDEDGEIAEILYPDINNDGRIGKHLLRKDDVLFAAKGSKNFATCFKNDNIAAVASTTFFVLRLQVKNVLPEYLTWFLNHPNTQLLLKGQAIGSSMASISKTVLEDIEIPIPDIKKQELILSIYKLRKREKQLKQKLQQLKEQYIQQRLFSAITI